MLGTTHGKYTEDPDGDYDHGQELGCYGDLLCAVKSTHVTEPSLLADERDSPELLECHAYITSAEALLFS